MENPEEILHSLEEFTKTKPKDIPRELEEYLCFVAKTGDPVYQWPTVKSLFREKMISVITDFYETCPSVEIPPCPNVDIFNYDVMKTFILEKLDTFAAAPFTVQRICELLTTPKKEYNRIDKYMRALEKNILVVSTTEPGDRKSSENGEGIVNGLESEHLPETSNSSDINVEEMDDTPSWPSLLQKETVTYQNNSTADVQPVAQETMVTASKVPEIACSSTQETVIACHSPEEPYVSIEPVPSNTCARQDNTDEPDVSVTITAIPAGVQKRRNSVEPVVSSESTEEITESSIHDDSSDTSVSTSGELNVKEETSSSQHVEDADSSSNHEEDVGDKEEKLAVTSSLDLEQDETIPYHKYTIPYNIIENRNNEVDTSQIIDNDTSLQQIKTHTEDSDEVIVDTTKCSNSLPSAPCEEIYTKTENELINDEAGAETSENLNEASSLKPNEKIGDKIEEYNCNDAVEKEISAGEEIKENAEDLEITSSCKIDEVHSSERELISDEAEASAFEDLNEASLNSNDEAKDKIEEFYHNVAVEEQTLDVCDKEADNLTTPMEVDEDYSSCEKVEEVVRAEATSDSPL